MPKPHLSIILPFRSAERETLATTLLHLDEALGASDYPYEVLVLEENARTELRTFSDEFSGLFKKTAWFENDTIRGTGDLFRQGMLKARGAFRLFLEPSALSAFQGISEALRVCGTGSEIVIGRRAFRKLSFDSGYPVLSRFLTISKTFLRELFHLIFPYDTQSGFILLSETAAEKLALLMRVQNRGFVRELLILGKRFGFTALSLPLPWRPSSRTLTFRDHLASLFQGFKVRLWIKKGKYDT